VKVDASNRDEGAESVSDGIDGSAAVVAITRVLHSGLEQIGERVYP
jgi:hypothetical protein